MEKRLFVVLRKSSIYNENIVCAFRDKLLEKNPDISLYCLHSQDVNPIDGVKMISFKNSWDHWWSKMELFRPDLDDLRPFLYSDLDNVFLNSCDSLFEILNDSTFSILHGFIKNKRRKFNSSIMGLNKDESGHFSLLYSKFKDLPKKDPMFNQDNIKYGFNRYTDQEYIYDNLGLKATYFQDFLPENSITRYKSFRKLPIKIELDNMMVVCCTGRRKPWRIKRYPELHWDI